MAVKILIVDDDRQVIQQLRVLLSEFGYSSDFISKSELLFPKLARDIYDLILLDIYMPDTDGITLLKQLKTHPTYQNIPVIMLTGDMDDQLLSKCFDCGSTDFVYKPIKALVLQARVKFALTANEYIKQISSQKETLQKQTIELQHANKLLEESLVQLRKTQTQLIQSEKMAALGGLVAGVAHEINTPVGVGVTAASHLAMKVQEYHERYKSGQLTREDFEVFLKTICTGADMIVSNLRRAADLIRSFKQVSVDQSNEEQRVFKVKPYINDVLQSLVPKFKRTQHTITVHCSDELLLCSYPGVFSQIITNLLMNSLEHGFEDKEKGEIVIDIFQQEEKFLFKYTDNGKGIASEHLKKIFEPFFTTKRGKGGTGLGMHIVYNLVTQTLGGQIECTSILGQGTTFQLWFTNQALNDQLMTIGENFSEGCQY